MESTRTKSIFLTVSFQRENSPRWCYVYQHQLQPAGIAIRHRKTHNVGDASRVVVIVEHLQSKQDTWKHPINTNHELQLSQWRAEAAQIIHTHTMITPQVLYWITREAHSTLHAVGDLLRELRQRHLQQQIHHPGEQGEDGQQVTEPGSAHPPFQPDSFPEEGHHVEVEVEVIGMVQGGQHQSAPLLVPVGPLNTHTGLQGARKRDVGVTHAVGDVFTWTLLVFNSLHHFSDHFSELIFKKNQNNNNKSTYKHMHHL